ncbi:hypothetical protein AVEN_166184-1 [Araneus ventricosus]|uniref:Uncharacterized protein n=1 Tax=Araneus ventricosus TaxID=182803 RepID=A0A4Y2DB33_ARAVE|nr:hypothetical protein AVEN_166184-1 [Araneus ventricosus]
MPESKVSGIHFLKSTWKLRSRASNKDIRLNSSSFIPNSAKSKQVVLSIHARSEIPLTHLATASWAAQLPIKPNTTEGLDKRYP